MNRYVCPDIYNLAATGFTSITLGVAIGCHLSIKRNQNLRANIRESTEEVAITTAKNANLSKWEEVIQLEPNPNYRTS